MQQFFEVYPFTQGEASLIEGVLLTTELQPSPQSRSPIKAGTSQQPQIFLLSNTGIGVIAKHGTSEQNRHEVAAWHLWVDEAMGRKT